MPAHRVVSATRVIDAPAAAIFDVLADPAKHSLIDGSGTVHTPTSSTPRLTLGATFSMKMTMGLPYVTKNRVVEFKEGRVIAWHHFARFVWRYELVPVGTSTSVTESFDYSVPWGILLEPIGVPARNRSSMEQTLASLDALVTGKPGSTG